jgi:NADH-quinone oxidoreductase subunit G
MATITVDGRAYTVADGQNLLHACLSLGLNLPYFCWHPALGSVGACRQCAVKVFKDAADTRGRILMACMTPAADGTRLAIEDPEAREFRESVSAWLMVHHPHDCPVCDEGGECHLQDMTVMTGHAYRHYRDEKRTFRNQDLGPFVNHEMNRCIQCYRCVRFYRDYAGGRDFNAFALRDRVFFGRHQDGALESDFSGNLVEVCPTGVFTDKTLKQHYTRKWDLQTAPSVCVHCSLGCNTIPGERYGQLRRIRNRYNGDVNGYFLCDRGRYGYEFVNSERRVRHPLLRRNGGREPVSKAAALAELGPLLRDPARLIGIGSPSASLEANFALRSLVGPERFFLGMSDSESRLVRQILDILQRGPARTPSLAEIEQADAVLVLGEDVANTAPRLALALRQSVRQQPMEIARSLRIAEWDDAAVREALQDARGPLFLATPHPAGLAEIATATLLAAPADLARLGCAVAHAIAPTSPAVPGLPEAHRQHAETIAGALLAARRPVVISGTTCASDALIQAAANVAWALHQAGRPAGLSYVLPECNSMGLGLLGGRDLSEALRAAREGRVDTAIVLENDLFRRADTPAVQEFLARTPQVIALSALDNGLTDQAAAVLPAATFAEGDGTFVSHEGRAQRFFQVFVPEGEIQESWGWLRDLWLAAGREEASGWKTLDDLLGAMAAALPALAPARDAAPPASFRTAGLKVARQPHRASGRTAIGVDRSVHETPPPADPDTALAFSMEGATDQPPRQSPAALTPRFWAPGWNSVQALNKFQEEVGGPLRGGDPGRRLIEPGAGRAEWFSPAGKGFSRRPGEWLAVAIPHIFGSEELSLLTPGVALRAPRPYLALAPEDAAALGVREGDPIEVAGVGASAALPLHLLPGLPPGLAGIPAGLPGVPWIPAASWVRLVPSARAARQEAA